VNSSGRRPWPERKKKKGKRAAHLQENWEGKAGKAGTAKPPGEKKKKQNPPSYFKMPCPGRCPAAKKKGKKKKRTVGRSIRGKREKNGGKEGGCRLIDPGKKGFEKKKKKKDRWVGGKGRKGRISLLRKKDSGGKVSVPLEEEKRGGEKVGLGS